MSLFRPIALATVLALCLVPALPHRVRAEGIDPKQAECLALAMYFEARAEGRDGMRAVGHVILNRVADSRFPSTVCGVVQQGGEGRGCQFSWYCDGRSDVPTHRRSWRRAGALSYQLLADRLLDTTEGALFYHATWIGVPWTRPRTPTRVIGNHAFYR